MARTNLAANRIKPETSELITLTVQRTARISPSFVRVTLGGGDIDRFVYMGYDQWFRLFIPVSEDSLSRLPNKLNALAYARYLTIAKTSRPVLRNYTVRAYRPATADGSAGPELDVDFVIHGSAADGTAGPAASWAETCSEGDAVAILDEGIGFVLDPAVSDVLLVADETGLPAVAGILASLPAHITGRAIVEVPAEGDRSDLARPDGVVVDWVVRTDAHAVPGVAALAAAKALPPRASATRTYSWAVGESALPVALRRHWMSTGVAKDDIMFCGYWKAAAH